MNNMQNMFSISLTSGEYKIQYQLEYIALKHMAPDAQKTGQVASTVLFGGAV
jgi:hypothetical protein